MKMMSDFYSRLETKGILNLPASAGYMVIVIFQKMQLLSLSNIGNEGVIDFKNIKENIYEEIAIQIDEEVKNIRTTINACSRVGWLEEIHDVNNNVIGIYIYELEVGSEADSSFRSRKSRLKQYLKQYPTDKIERMYNIDMFYKVIIKHIDKGRIQTKKALLDMIEKLLQCNNLPSMLHCNIETEKEKETETETETETSIESENNKIDLKFEFEKRGIRFDLNVQKQFSKFDIGLILKELNLYYINKDNIRNPLAWLFVACKNHYQLNTNNKTLKTIKRTNTDELKIKQLELLKKEKGR